MRHLEAIVILLWPLTLRVTAAALMIKSFTETLTSSERKIKHIQTSICNTDPYDFNL